MARAKRNPHTRDTPPADIAPRAAKVIPSIAICPVCHTLLGEFPIDVHLRNHWPERPCTYCATHGLIHTEYQIDWDEIVYPHVGCSPFRCNPCGHFAPMAS